MRNHAESLNVRLSKVRQSFGLPVSEVNTLIEYVYLFRNVLSYKLGMGLGVGVEEEICDGGLCS